MGTLSGPMFEPAQGNDWTSVHRKEGAHYNTFYAAQGADEMELLRHWFENGEANEMNFVLFSTSGIHGTYGTIEDAARELRKPELDDDGKSMEPDVTFLVVQPRIVCLRYGNCKPKNSDDIAFLKKLRASSWKAARKIGAP